MSGDQNAASTSTTRLTDTELFLYSQTWYGYFLYEAV